MRLITQIFIACLPNINASRRASNKDLNPKISPLVEIGYIGQTFFRYTGFSSLEEGDKIPTSCMILLMQSVPTRS